MKRLFLWTLSLGISSSSLLCGCSQESGCDLGGVSEGVTAVEFSATKITTRVSGDNWSAGDCVGIFASNAAPEGVSYSNVEYYVTSAESGSLTPRYRDQQIFVEADEKYDYVAYYPYSDAVSTSGISINLLDQSDITGLEIMRAELSDVTGESVSLVFDHLLAKLSLDLSIVDGSTIESLSDCTILFSGAALVGEYSFTKKEIENVVSGVSSCQVTLPLIVASDGLSATVEALVIPMDNVLGTKIIITTAEGKSVYYSFGDDSITEWESGNLYNYEIKL